MSETTTAALDAAQKRETLNIRNRLKSPCRHFVYSKFSKDSYKIDATLRSMDEKIKYFADGEVGTVSDCYLIYAVAALGFTDLEAVRLFLTALHRKNADLSIPNMRNTDLIRSRMEKLRATGLLLKHRYEVPRQQAIGENGETVDILDDGTNNITLYNAAASSISLINNKLGRPVALDQWAAAKPLYTIMGWASCAYVAGRIAQSKNYVDQIQGVYQTPAVGKVLMPSLLKMLSPDGSEVEYVGVFPAFLHLDKTINTEEMFEKNCEYMFRRMKQFFFYHDKKSHLARMIIVVEDNSDLVQMAMRIHAFGDFVEDYDRIFFTGEGPMRMAKTVKLVHCFLRMAQDGSEQGYTFIPASPDFI